MDSLEVELRQLVQVFNREGIDYALCGGMAVAVHGFPRFTKDIDLLVPASSLEHAKRAAKMVGFLDEAARIPFPTCDVHRVIKAEGSQFRMVDLIVPKNLESSLAWKQREWFEWNGLKLCVVSVEGLVEMKRAASRDVDLIDIKNLGYEP